MNKNKDSAMNKNKDSAMNKNKDSAMNKNKLSKWISIIVIVWLHRLQKVCPPQPCLI